MKLFFLLSFCLFNLQLQTADLNGKWLFSKFESSKPVDDEIKTVLQNYYSNFALELRNDTTYDFFKRRKNESGSWKSDSKTITITNSDGFVDTINYTQKHKDTLRLEIEQNSFIVMYRSQ